MNLRGLEDATIPEMTETWTPEGYTRHAAFVPELGAALLDDLDPRPGERILDLGCGDGVLSARITARGATVLGVDSSAEMLAAAGRRGIAVQQISGEALTFNREFDAVFSNAALHWMRDADRVVAGVARALRPGGRFVGEFGGHGNIAAISVAIRSVMRARGVPTTLPWYYPTADEYSAKLVAHGFRVDRIALIPRPTPLPTGIAGWLETFAGSILGKLPPDQRLEATHEIEELLRPALCDERGQWTADYVRLRYVAVLT